MEHTTETKESTDMNSHTMPVLPLVANGYNGDCHDGLEGKDAVLIHANQTALNHNLLQDSVNRNSKENVIESLNAKFENERAFRDMEFRLSTQIRDEADRTRAEMFREEVRRLERDRTDSKFDALAKLIEGIGTGS